MVRLRQIRNKTILTKILFQFHMVRLRLNKTNAHKTEETLFQFHMVRLRLPRVTSLFIKHTISIPHGTIKTPQQENNRGEWSLFQFHMVRLRLRTFRTRNSPKAISIPHGTIKTTLVSLYFGISRNFNSTWYD